MSYVSSDYVQCETLQSMLDNEFAICPTLEALPALEAIISTQKANGIQQSVADGSGKVRTIKVINDQRLAESAVTDSSGTRSCTTSTETFNKYTDYTIDSTQWLKAEESFNVANLATVCSDDVQSMYAKKLFKIVDVLERKIATQTAEELTGMIGNWASDVSNVNGSDELELATLVSTATKQLDPFMWGKLQIALNKTGYCANPVIVGGSDFYEANMAFNAGCCSDTGVNIETITAQYGKAVLWDRRVETALGNAANKTIAFQPGSIALINYNEAPQVPFFGGNYVKFRVNGYRTGIPIDIVINDTCGVISIIGYANTKLVGLPLDMFAASDVYNGVTFVNKIKVVNPA